VTRLLVVASVLALLVTGSGAAAIGTATIVPNRGAGGATLGMTRAQAVAALGQPVSENANGVLTYATGNRIFDVYRTGPNGRVRMFVLSGRNYCTAAGICTRRAGGVGKLQARYGNRLVTHTNPDGLECYFLRGWFGGRAVTTNFVVSSTSPGARILDVIILYGRPGDC
jgi:hypothetical protein